MAHVKHCQGLCFNVTLPNSAYLWECYLKNNPIFNRNIGYVDKKVNFLKF